MTQFNRYFPRISLLTLIALPLSVMALLSITVLLPTLRNPESKMYSSGIGYPALKRALRQPIKVQTTTARLQSLEAAVAAPGESVALEDVTLSTLVMGTIEQVHVVEGQWVRKGQLLLSLDAAPFEDTVSQSRNQLAQTEASLQALQRSTQLKLQGLQQQISTEQKRVDIAQTQLEIARSLETEGAIGQTAIQEKQDRYLEQQQELDSTQQSLAQIQSDSNSQIQQLQLQLQDQQVALRQALRNLSQTRVHANMDGLITQVNVYNGESVNPGLSVMTLSQDVVFKAYIDQAQLNQVKIGDRATVRLVAYPGKIFEGRVLRLNPTVQTDPVRPGAIGVDRQYTYSVWVAVEDLQMPTGLQGYAEFNQSKQSIVIPESAVTHLSQAEGMVMVIDEEGQALLKQVKLGRTYGNQREVLEGLTPNTQVVVYPRAINPGDQLKAES